MSTKTLSIRIDDEDYRFLSSLAEEEKENVSDTVRELVDMGRIMLAIERYKKSEVSIEKASKIAGVSLSRMMDLLVDFGVEANMEYEDYLTGLRNIRKIWK
ncbi:MAG TPA: UPF0175 family protein [Candidatus Brocadiales bacterium]|nr:UPF0175 family protein [Candidatus Brocadiales bacterium]